MTEFDKQNYPSDMRQIIWSDFLYTYALGVRKYIYKETNDQEISRIKYYKFAHYTLVAIIALIFCYLIYLCFPYIEWKCSNFYQWSCMYYDSL